MPSLNKVHLLPGWVASFGPTRPGVIHLLIPRQSSRVHFSRARIAGTHTHKHTQALWWESWLESMTFDAAPHPASDKMDTLRDPTFYNKWSSPAIHFHWRAKSCYLVITRHNKSQQGSTVTAACTCYCLNWCSRKYLRYKFGGHYPTLKSVFFSAAKMLWTSFSGLVLLKFQYI